METPTGQKKARLSRFFVGNTQVDAGTCPKSYAVKELITLSEDSNCPRIKNRNKDTRSTSGERSKYFEESVVIEKKRFFEMESLVTEDEAKRHYSMSEVSCFSRGQLDIKEKVETEKPQIRRRGSSRRNRSKKLGRSLDMTQRSRCCFTQDLPNFIGEEFTEAKWSPNNDKTEISANVVSKSEKLLRETLLNLNNPAWRPPCSPHNLIEEGLANNPWGLLVATIFLNKTSCSSASPLLNNFLKENPHPPCVLEKSPESLEKYFDTLGLQRTRSIRVWRMTHDFVHKEWKSVRELYGIGRYGEEAFKMFCLGDMSFEPDDRFLKIYRAWYLMKEKDGWRSNKIQEDREDFVGTDGERRKTNPGASANKEMIELPIRVSQTEGGNEEEVT